MRVFTGFQLSNVVIPSVNEFIASPTVHCFAYARGTNDHHPVSGASEAKPGCDKEAMGCARSTERLPTVGRAAQLPAAVGRLWSLRGFFLTRQKETSQYWVAGTLSPCMAFLRGFFFACKKNSLRHPRKALWCAPIRKICLLVRVVTDFRVVIPVSDSFAQRRPRLASLRSRR